MSIGTHTELKDAIKYWLEDTSGAHAAQYDNFIALGEALFTRRLRIREMETTLTGVTFTGGTATIDLPAQFAGMRRFEYSYGGGSHTPSEVSAEKAVELYGFAGNGPPEAYTIEGDKIRLWPTPDSSYSYAMVYRKKPDAITASNTTGWLLTKAPDLYLFAALVQATTIIDNPKGSGWVTMLQTIIADLDAESIFDSATDQARVLTARGTP